MTTTDASWRDPSLTYPPVADLDAEMLASTLVRMVMLSATLGHKHPSSTAEDYASHVNTPEGRFVRAVLTKTTEEICDEWFGGLTRAAISSSRLMEIIIPPPQRETAT